MSFLLNRGGIYLFSESFFEGIQREVLRNPRLGMALVACVLATGFTTILHRRAHGEPDRVRLVDEALPQRQRLCGLDARYCCGICLGV